MAVATLLGLVLKNGTSESAPDDEDGFYEDDDCNGMRNGWDGYGEYMNGWKIK